MRKIKARAPLVMEYTAPCSADVHKNRFDEPAHTTQNDDVERVAKAIRKVRGGCRGDAFFKDCYDKRADGSCWCTDMARAAIDAMRAPVPPQDSGNR